MTADMVQRMYMDHMVYIHTGQNMEELKLILDGVGVDIDIIFIYTQRLSLIHI